MARDISNMADVIDSRDVMERIEELNAERVCSECEGTGEVPTTVDDEAVMAECADCKGTGLNPTFDGDDELDTLEALARQGEGYGDWKYGEVLVRDSYFEDYARQLAEDTGAIRSDATWPSNCIDWEQAARELQQDYTSVEFDGVTYWMRS